MELEFKLSGTDSERELDLLYGWLADDRELREEVRLKALHERETAGEMGLGLEAILAIVSTAATLGQLPFSYSAWRAGHRPSSQTVIYVRDGGAEALQTVRDAFPDAHVYPQNSEAPEAPEDSQASQGGRSTQEDSQ